MLKFQKFSKRSAQAIQASRHLTPWALLVFIPLLLSSCGVTSGPSLIRHSSLLLFNQGQDADFVLGQASFGAASGNSASAKDFTGPTGIRLGPSGGMLLVDTSGNRVLGYNAAPLATYPTADFILGQTTAVATSPGSGLNQFNTPYEAHYSGDYVLVADSNNNRVSFFPVFGSSIASTAPFALGGGGANCAADNLTGASSVFTANGKMVVVVNANPKLLLLYNSIPNSNTPADLALGSTGGFGACALSILNPVVGNVWTDGTRILYSDQGNHRVLVWNTWPTTFGQSPDLVLGQRDFSSTTANQGFGPQAYSLMQPQGLFSEQNQIFVADTGNNRVLVWNTWPTSNGAKADVVLGQTSFVTNSSGSGAAQLNNPRNLTVIGANLYVSDTGNARVSIFQSQ